MTHEYYTIFAASAKEFDIELNKKAKLGWWLSIFEYKEYPQKIKDEGTTIMQSYVGIMTREINDDPNFKHLRKD